MVASLRALLHGIIDYAGMFPPASLPLAEALQDYSRHLGSQQSWMLSRFICPVGKLSEIEPAALQRSDGRTPWRMAIIGRGGEDAEAFTQSFRQDLAAVDQFSQRAGIAAVMETFEVRLPRQVVAGGGRQVGELARRAGEMLCGGDGAALQVFLEIPVTAVAAGIAEEAVHSIGRLNQQHAGKPGRPFGVKIRTGGTEPPAFPASDQVAAFIAACRESGLAFKATAGLHHPLRRHDAGIGTMMHGFLNLFVAAALAHALRIDLPSLVEVLEAQKLEGFSFSDASLRWRDLQVDTRQVEMARAELALGYGSCSFNEPVRDLQSLGLM